MTRIDALAPLVSGSYDDDFVTVTAGRDGGEQSLSTEHFDVAFDGGRVRVAHALPPSEVDDDLATMLQRELFDPGWLRGGDLFERVFTGVVRSGAEDALAAWELFYRNTLARLEAGRARPAADRPGRDPGSIDALAPVHQHALELLSGDSVLELGCCFGFLALHIARAGRTTEITASDASPGTVRLLEAIASRLGVRLSTVTADAARFPADDGHADTVFAVHLLEHLEPDHGTQVVTEAIRLARRRVVIAVSLGSEADETYGHVRTVSLDDLRRWGRATGHRFDVHELHGGWLVVDLD